MYHGSHQAYCLHKHERCDNVVTNRNVGQPKDNLESLIHNKGEVVLCLTNISVVSSSEGALHRERLSFHPKLYTEQREHQ